MKNNLKLTYTGDLFVAEWGVKLGDSGLEGLLSGALLTEKDIVSTNLTARVTITIEDLSDPLRIERPEELAKEERA